MLTVKNRQHVSKALTNGVTCSKANDSPNKFNDVALDIFGNIMPEWVLHLLPQYLIDNQVRQGLNKAPQHFMSKSQRILCSIPFNIQHSNYTNVQCARFSSHQQDVNLELFRNCLTHSREFCRINIDNGDVISEVDYGSPFLDIHGEKLTSDARSLQELHALQQRILKRKITCKGNSTNNNSKAKEMEASAVTDSNENGESKEHVFLFDVNNIQIDYNDDNSMMNTADINRKITKSELEKDNRTCVIPFYVTERDVRKIQQFYSFLQTRQSNLESMSKIKEIFNTNDLTAHVVNEKNETCKVANLGSLYKTPPGKYLLSVMFSVFRKFKPVNVLTKRSFCEHITERLRIECAHSRRWCSVWGTSEEYKQCDIDVLDGALSVHTVDSLGNPIELIDAICTEDPFKAYCTVYPDKSIFHNIREKYAFL